MKIAYLDVFAGISGDMTLGALVDAGADINAIRAELGKVPMHGWRIAAEKRAKAGIVGTKVTVSLTDHDHEHGREGGRDHDHEHGPDRGQDHGHGNDAHHHHHEPQHHHGRPARELVDMIEASTLDPEVIRRSTGILWRVADAEAKIHGKTREEVHFHELGGLDSIVDIVGAVIGFRLLGVEQVICSPLPVSHGHVECAHGRLPVPAPATAELMRGAPIFPLDVDGETVTPTGAAIATGLADCFGQFPPMSIEAIGYGCGYKDFPGVPNVLRLFIGERTGPMPGVEGGEGSFGTHIADRIRLIEANIDDMNPEFFGRVMERAFAAGAADVWLTPITMKKSRPATQLSAVCDPAKAEAVAAAILEESTTFGVRMSDWDRRCLPREKVSVETPYGPITVKIGRLGDRVVSASPEYDDCAAAAENHGVSIKQVYAAAVALGGQIG